MKPIKVVIVEDLEEVVEGLKAFFNEDRELELTATYRTAEAALLELPILLPDIVIMDINLPKMSGIECIRQVKPLAPSIQFMMFTVYENDNQVFEALKAGATGYLLKKTPPQKIIEAVKDLHQGGSPMSATIARKLIEEFNGNKQKQSALPESALLTPREQEVLNLLAKGLLYKEISDELHISLSTVRQHIHKVYEKLQVQNKVEALNKMFKRF